MLRRTFMFSTPGSLIAIALAVSGCTTTGASDASGDQMDKRHSIDAGFDSTLARLYSSAKGSRELVAKARGVLIFPSVIDAGFGVGGQYGEGSLRVGGRTVGYYSTATGSIIKGHRIPIHDRRRTQSVPWQRRLVSWGRRVRCGAQGWREW